MLVMPLFASPLIPAAMAMALCGLFLIIARRQALTQVIGYLVFENGIYLFGLAISAKNPLLVELGVLLDVFVGVFVMGIVIYHINREFDSISVEDLRMLKE
jgi:hydrogenase-4 component E